MTEPRTVAGKAWMSATRPFVRRAMAQTIVAIETEAAEPYLEALRAADRVLWPLALMSVAEVWDDATRLALVERAEAAHQLLKPLLGEAADSA